MACQVKKLARLRRLSYWTVLLVAAIVVGGSISLQPVVAGPEFEDWHPLPQIARTVFSKSAVGFISKDNRYLVFTRAQREFRQVAEPDFRQVFAEIPSDNPVESGREELTLRASDGTIFTAKYAYCDEGENIPHQLRLDGKTIRDVVERCTSIGAVDIIGAQLWLGTFYNGEGGEFPAQGILVQPLKQPKLLKQISSKTGLTGDLIRVIRRDPETGYVWVATEWGLNEVDRDFRVISRWYFYEDFDAHTGVPAVFVYSQPKPTNPFAVVSRVLKLRDAKAVYESVRKIPPAAQRQFRLYDFFMCCSGPEFSVELNELVPFFLGAARSEDREVRWLALANACRFNDHRVLTFLRSWKESDPNLESIANCNRKLGM